MLTFVVGHFINHTLGLISIEALEAGRAIFIAPWRTLVGSVLIVGAVLIHAGIGLSTLFRRRNLKLKSWEMTQLILGLTIPLTLAGHILATWGLIQFQNVQQNYANELLVLWVFNPEFGIVQTIALFVVWSHACIGIHTWLRLKIWYAALQTYIFAFALVLPTLALAGFVASGVQVTKLGQNQAWVDALQAKMGLKPFMVDWILDLTIVVSLAWIAIIAAIFIARKIRAEIAKKAKRSTNLYYKNFRESRVVEIQLGASVLEALRAAGIPQASVCGGRGRCTTCRVKIGKGLDQLPPAQGDELKALSRIHAPDDVRLACQIRPATSLEITPLLPAGALPTDGHADTGYSQGQERQVVILFADLRDSTKLAEDRLPYDVVFILNQFFAEMAATLEDTNGHYAQFNGDGLMALYGLETDIELAAIQALQGAQQMLRRLDILNQRLGQELSTPLKMGIGIHVGDAIVGSMGPPATPIISALGDNVNIAARLEAKTKDYGAPLVVSASTAISAGVDLSGFDHHTVEIRGRDQDIDIYAINEPDEIDVPLI